MKEVKDIHFFGVEVSVHLTFLSDWVIICYLHNLNTKKNILYPKDFVWCATAPAFSYIMWLWPVIASFNA